MEKKTAILLQGTRLNKRYKTGRMLGMGGFGITYLALDEQIGKEVVVKEYFPAFLADRREGESALRYPEDEKQREEFEKGRKKFLEEARRMSALQGVAEIVRVLDYFQENETAYIVMEYVRGTSLRKYLECLEGPMSFAQARDFLLPIVRALEQMHKKGIIHRDLTPDNIMVKEDKSLKILDFGAAREYTDYDRTKTVLVKGGYAPLEQYSKKEKQGPWSDVYALCATMYEMITGVVPEDALKRMKADELYPPSLYGAEISPQEERVLMKGLALDYQERWQDMKALQKGLLLKESGPEEKKTGRFRQTAGDESGKHQQTAGDGAGKLRWAAAAFALLLCLAAVFFIWQCRGKYGVQETVVYAGNYERASDEYGQFCAFVRENAVSQEETEEGILYGLTEEAVLEWGQPCNSKRFEKSLEELEEFLEKEGYSREIQSTGDFTGTVEIRKYGAVLTEFFRTVIYRPVETLEMRVTYDAVNRDILQVVFARSAEGDGLAEAVAGVCGFLVKYGAGNTETLAAQLEEMEKEGGETDMLRWFSWPDSSLRLNWQEEQGWALFSLLPGKFSLIADDSGYYWP